MGVFARMRHFYRGKIRLKLSAERKRWRGRGGNYRGREGIRKKALLEERME